MQDPIIRQPSETDEYWFQEGCWILESWNAAEDPAVSIARARVEPGKTTKPHLLEGIVERYLITTGTGLVTIGNLTPIRVNPGDVVVIPAGVTQQIQNDGQADLVFYCICTPRFVPEAYRSKESKRVAFIFDDGPHPTHTPILLDAFRRVGGRATFSYVGQNVDAHPDLARKAVEAGHEIMNHTYTHPHLRELTDPQIIQEIHQTQAAVENATGIAPAQFWIPYGEHDERVLRAIAASGTPNFFPTGFNFVSTNDWNVQLATEEHIFRQATHNIADQTIILAHEWPANTMAQINRILDYLVAEGCEFLTVSQLIKVTN